MVHSLFSIVAPVVGSGPITIREDDLAFDSLGMVHFASVVVFDKPAGAKEGEFPRHVVFESAIDGEVDDYFAALVFEPVRRAALADLFASCEGFDSVNRHSPDSEAYRTALAAYLKAHVLWPDLFHIGSPGMRVDQITAGAALRCALDELVKESVPAGLSHESPLVIAARLRKELQVPVSAKTHWHLDPASAKTREYAWFSDPVGLWRSRILNWGKLGLAGRRRVVAYPRLSDCGCWGGGLGGMLAALAGHCGRGLDLLEMAEGQTSSHRRRCSHAARADRAGGSRRPQSHVESRAAQAGAAAPDLDPSRSACFQPGLSHRIHRFDAGQAPGASHHSLRSVEHRPPAQRRRGKAP